MASAAVDAMFGGFGGFADLSLGCRRSGGRGSGLEPGEASRFDRIRATSRSARNSSKSTTDASRCKGSPVQLNAASRSSTSKKPRCVLAQDGEWLRAGLNVAGSVVLCLLAVWLGYLAGAVVNL
jgi:hypothetical protein